MTPKAYAMAYRSERMRAELKKCRTVTEAIYEAGFNSNGRFTRTPRKYLVWKRRLIEMEAREQRFVSP